MVIAITGAGFGEILKFETYDDAFLHPVVQYGDAIARSAEELPDLYNRYEWRKLMKLAGVEDKLVEDALDTLSIVEERAVRVGMSEKIWRMLGGKAQDPPADIAGIFAMVARDRRPQEKKMAAETTSDTPAAKSTGEYAPDTKLRYGVDAEGKKWSAQHCPFREGSNRATRWVKFKNNCTVEWLLNNGFTLKNLDDMVTRGFVTVHPKAGADHATEPEAEADPPAEEQAAA